MKISKLTENDLEKINLLIEQRKDNIDWLIQNIECNDNFSESNSRKILKDIIEINKKLKMEENKLIISKIFSKNRKEKLNRILK